jgi:hypothetical protein
MFATVLGTEAVAVTAEDKAESRNLNSKQERKWNGSVLKVHFCALR